MDTHILVNIARQDFRVWITMSMTNHELNRILNIQVCEAQFGRTIKYPNRTIRLLGGKLHSAQQPAIEWMDSHRSEYYFKGRYHALTHPAVKYYNRFERLYYSCWYLDGKLHREDASGRITLPAIEAREHNGKIVKEVYYKHGVKHRDGDMAAYTDDRAETIQYWYNGKFHRAIFDTQYQRSLGPAVLIRGVYKYWYVNGVLHSPAPDQPSVVTAFEHGFTRRWHEHGVTHRIGGPAVITASGGMSWYYKGLRHRGPENDPNYNDEPAEVYSNHTLAWYKHGVLHREGDKPAFISEFWAYSDWYENGKRHRLTGPARVPDCTKYYAPFGEKYYIHGVRYTEAEFWREVNILKQLTPGKV